MQRTLTFCFLLCLFFIASEARTISNAGITLITDFEGFSSCKYKDPVGLWTIGYGHLIKPGEKFNKCISKAEATKILKQDLNTAESCVNRYVKTSINQHQFDALVSFTYNLGCGSLASSTLLKKVNARKFSQVCSELLLWVHGNGKVLPGLVRRRKAECKLFNN